MYHFGVAKTARLADLAINDRRPGMTIFQWLYDELRSAILDGRLKRGLRLPSTREFAKRYSVARGTVVTVFEQLTAEGYLEGKVGAGTNVNTLLPDDLLNAQIRPVLNAGRSSERSAKVRLSDYGLRLNPVPQLPVLPVRAFRPLQPAVDEFPMSLWAQIASRRMRRASLSLLADSDSRGYRPL